MATDISDFADLFLVKLGGIYPTNAQFTINNAATIMDKLKWRSIIVQQANSQLTR